jgi:type VI secretion system secreted protein VgrG
MSEQTRVDTHRVMGITTPLGENKLLMYEMRGTESLGRLFEFELDLVSEESNIDHTQILGKNVTVRLNLLASDNPRYFNGFISRFAFAGIIDLPSGGKRLYHYRATLVPWTWFLTRRADCRIFQTMSIPDIVKSVCNSAGFTDLDFQTTGNYAKWDYCVQYRETDFNFISRLMENEGMYYYFTHKDGKHTMVVCDANSAHSAASGYGSLAFHLPYVNATNDAYLWDWTIDYEATPIKFTLRDYNMTTPSADMERSKQSSLTHDNGKFRIFDYPGGYQVGDDGVKYAQTRMEQANAEYAVAEATTRARGIFAGATFKLEDHPVIDSAEYLITSVSYQMQNDDMPGQMGASRTGGAVYQAKLTSIPNAGNFRPRRLTPKPVVQGPQTAVVVGPSGDDDIYVDQYGRVKVQFYWDQQGQKNEKSSCWIRVAQSWAGKAWGMVFHPRIGQEVIVEFLEGDPDRPIITGRVYNADQTVPYALPANKTQSTIKSRSSTGGTTDNFNEIRFEDKKGSEQILIHAEKNQDIEVENDESHSVGHDRQKTVGHDETTNVKHDRTETVGNDETISITGNRTETVGKDESISIGGNRTETVGKDESINITGGRTESVGKNEEVSIAKDRTVSVGGNDTLNVSKTLSITATDEIDITTGDASIIMKKDGTIQIKGKDITIEGSGSITVKASGDMTLKGSSIKQN